MTALVASGDDGGGGDEIVGEGVVEVALDGIKSDQPRGFRVLGSNSRE